LCNLPWAIHNYYMQYRYSMDDAILRDCVFPRLKRAINYYLHHLKDGPDGKLHITTGLSPEYHKEGGHPDCNIDLALLRWGCQTLLDTCQRLKIDDPLIPKWKDVLARLTPYPTDKNGLMISADTPFAMSHRHYSHLLMIYPLYIMNWDQPENRDLITRSLDHWMSMPAAQRGYSYTGASAICASIGRRDDALKYLKHFIDDTGRFGCQPNTFYSEAGPVIETPLSAARSLQDMLLQSWGGTIRVFPGVPDEWKEVTIHRLRTEGAFLVSAARRGGKTQWIRIESLAGEPCRLKCDLRDVAVKADHAVAIKQLADGILELQPLKGDAVLLRPAGSEAAPLVEAVEPQKDKANTFGVP
jgi:alpha-L-fucosidase 2